LDGLGERFDQAFAEMAEELERTRKAAEEAQREAAKAREAAEGAKGAVLDLQAEQQRLGGLQLDRIEEVRSLLEDVKGRLANAGMQRGEVKPRYSFSIQGEDERRAVKALLDRFDNCPRSSETSFLLS